MNRNTIFKIIITFFMLIMWSISLYHMNSEALIGWTVAYLYSFSILVKDIKQRKKALIFHCVSTSGHGVPCINCTKKTDFNNGVITCPDKGKIKIDFAEISCDCATYPEE